MTPQTFFLQKEGISASSDCFDIIRLIGFLLFGIMFNKRAQYRFVRCAGILRTNLSLRTHLQVKCNVRRLESEVGVIYRLGRLLQAQIVKFALNAT